MRACVRACSLVARGRTTQFTTNVAFLPHESRKRFQKGQLSEGVLNSGPGAFDFRSLVTRHVTGEAERPELFLSTRRLRNKGCDTKSDLSLNPGEYIFYSTVTKHDKRSDARRT